MLVHSHLKWQHFAVGIVLFLWLAGSVSAHVSGISDSESQTNLGGLNSIIGQVFAPSGRPIESRVRVKLSTMTRGDRYFTTNQNGNFKFTGLPAGSYTVIIDKEAEFKTVSQTVDIIQFRGAPAQTYTVNIRLEFKERNEPAKPSVVNAELLNVPKKALTHYEAALELARRGRAVTLLEARRIAWGASGRNGGSVSPAFSAGADAIRRHVDEDHYRQLYRLSMEGVEIIRDNIRDLRIADAHKVDGRLRVVRYEAANLLGLNFVLHDVLAGGASRSLRVDTQGKTLALALLRMEMELPEELRTAGSLSS